MIEVEEIIKTLNQWQECFDTADKVNDLHNMNLYADKLSRIHVWFIKSGWVVA